MAESFTDDILFKILLRLPVKSLMRFKCVRRGWRSLISDLGFARMHLQRLEERDMIPSQRIIKNCPLETVDHKALDGGGGTDGGNDHAVVESHEQRMNLHFWTHSYIVGTCDGLVCLSYGDIIDGSRRSLFYNPSTKESRELPDYYVQAKLYSGFGYAPRSDDYKIVQVGLSGLSADEWQVAIFSLKSDSWRSIRAQPESHPADYRRGVYWGGALHWCVIDWSGNNGDGETLIMSFDLSEEKFRRMLLVPQAAGNMAFVGLGIHGASLFIYKGAFNHCFEAWITIKCSGRGVGSWTKFFSVLAPINQIVDGKFLIAYTRSGKIVFQNGLYEMVLFNPEDNTCKKYPVQPDYIESASIYLETLVSPYHGSKPLSRCRVTSPSDDLCSENDTP